MTLAAASRRVAALLAVALLAAMLPGIGPIPEATAAEPDLVDGFRDEAIWSGLNHPSAVAFAPNGVAFVAEKSGRIYGFSSLTDTTPTLVADLATNVHNAWDRGLLGMTVDPGYPSRPYIYVLYTYDHILGDAAAPPRWGTAGAENDTCPNPPGYTADGCVVSGRLSRITISGGVQSGPEQVLLEDWCQQFPSHSVGQLMFGPEGALYASAGEGASFNLAADYGQLGGTKPDGGPYITPRNPCGDPPGGVGGEMTVPTAEGGSLRAQDIRTRGAADPVGLDGTLIRINPDTGAGWPSNANAADADANARRIIAYGLRNPFRFTINPSGAVWIGDVGSSEWEEINVVDNPSAAPRNFGWPCREGSTTNPTFVAAGLDLCTSLAAASTTAPYTAWSHRAEVVPGDGCGGATGFSSASISGLAFQAASSPFPAPYDGALFANDYSRRCIWAFPLTNGKPDPAKAHRLANLRRSSGTSGGAVQLTISPVGDLLYVDYDRGEIRRIRWYGPSQPPQASFTATPAFGALPLAVTFDASGSSDPNPEALSYAWDLDGDGAFDDGTGVTISRTYTVAGPVQVGLQVTDTTNLSDTTTVRIDPGNSPPGITSMTPSASLTWKVGDSIAFSANASDTQDGTLGAAAFHWTFEMLHCPGNDCHSHVIQELDGVKSGNFIAPDHEYPSHLRVTVTVTDSGGMTASVSRELQPVTATLSVASNPAGIPLTLGSVTGNPPPSVTGIVGSLVAVGAPDSALIGEDRYAFSSWSDGGEQNHDTPVPSGGGTVTATFVKSGTVDTPNSCSAAPAGATPTSGGWTSGLIGTPGDVDWYRFTMTSTRRVRIVLGDLAVGAKLQLYKGCSTLLSTSDQGGTNPEELFRTLPAGSYAVKITGKSKASSIPYALSIRRLTSMAFLSTRTLVSGSTLRLMGEIYNNTSKQRQVTVTAKLYSASNTLLATRSAVTVISTVEPYQRAPYVITGSLPAGFAYAKLSVSYPSTTRVVRRPAVSGTTSGPSATGYWTVQGKVRNTSTRTVSNLRIGVILYTSRLTVLEVVRATPSRTVLAAGSSATYSATSYETGLAPKFLRVRTSAYQR